MNDDNFKTMYNRKKHKHQKKVFISKLILLLVFFIIVGLIIYFIKNKNNTVDNKTVYDEMNDTSIDNSEISSNTVEDDVISNTKDIITDTTDSAISEKDNVNKKDWNLILVNPWNKLSDNFQSDIKLDLVQKNKYGTYNMDYRVVNYIKQMISDAKADGIELVVRSSFRLHSRQQELYDNRVEILEKQGYSHSDALVTAATINALPGTSEHETGLAVDILSSDYSILNEDFDKTSAFKWLSQNCYKYGFILRYPKDKTDITGIIYEPWHYRYVGKENSYKIYEKNITFEEYYASLPD